MNLAALFLIVIVIEISIITSVCERDWALGIIAGIIASLGALAGWMVFYVIAVSISDFEKIEIAEQKVNIISLRNDSGVSGSFFLGSGGIDTKLYYVTMVENGDSTVSMMKISGDDIRLLEDDSTPPNVQKFSEIRHSEKLKLWFGNGDLKGFNRKTVITVPKGTILRKFEVN